MAVEDCLSRTSCPIARQLLGCTTTMAGLYHGTVTPRRALEWATAPLSRGGRTIRERAQEGVLEGDVGHATTSRPLLEFGEQEAVVWEFQSGREVRQGAAL